MQTFRRLALALLTLAFLADASQAVAGTVSLAWDPVSDSDLAGYRVYYGTSAGSYTQSVDVGNVTQTTISGLNDCATYYFGIKAYDAASNESASYSNQISGWSRPTVASSLPNAAEAGRALSLVISGTNFQSGATVTFSNPGITVNSVTINGCNQLTVAVTIGSGAAAGAATVEVLNPDQVYGNAAGLFTVQAGVAPTVVSTSPANGATGITVNVTPSATFSEAMLPGSITSATVRLLNDTGAAVAQAAGSPSLSGDGLTATITPAAALQQAKTFRVQVVGGASGVKDLANRSLAATVTQTIGFTTAGDVVAPVISAITATGVGSTSATINWTTDEASDSQVFYRRQGTTPYSSTTVDTALVTSHSEAVTGLTPSTTYEYYVRSADAAGNASQSTVRTLTTTTSPFTYLSMEAEGGAIVAPVRIVNGATGAFGNAYIDLPSGTPGGSATAPAGTATFGVNIPTAGTWYLWVLMYGIDGNTDSWFESVNGASRQVIFASPFGTWTWEAGRSYTLPAGLASIELGGRNAQARVDRILITDDATFIPTEVPSGDQAPPAAVTNFQGVGVSGQIALSWTNPSSSDFTQTVVRYRTDGQFPTSPVDGFAATVKTGAPGSNGTYTHTGLTPGATYHYSAFSMDSSGNVGPKTTLAAVAADTTLPAPVNNLRRTDRR